MSLYTFTFGVGAVRITGGAVGMSSGVYDALLGVPTPFMPYASQFASTDMLVIGPNPVDHPLSFKATVDEIDHGLGPGTTVADLIDWISASTTTPSMLPIPATQVTFNPTGTGLVSTNVQAMGAELAGLVFAGPFVGLFDASGGVYPTTGNGEAGAIEAGNEWLVSVAGTVGDKILEVGDLLVAAVDNATADADFFALQKNQYNRLGHVRSGSAQLWVDPLDPLDAQHSTTTLSSAGSLNGAIAAFPFMVPRTITINAAVLNVVAAAAGSTMNVAIYNANQTTSVPTTKLADIMVAQSTATTGEKTATGLNITLVAGVIYDFAIRVSSSAVSLSSYSGNNIRAIFKSLGGTATVRWSGTDSATMPNNFPASPTAATTSTFAPFAELAISNQ